MIPTKKKGVMTTGLLDKIFRPKASRLQSYFKLCNGYSPAFSTFSGGLYELATIRAAVDAFALIFAKLKPEIRGDKLPELGAALAIRPNSVMDTFKFLYRLATVYLLENTVILAPLEDGRGKPVGVVPLPPSKCELVRATGRKAIYLRYTIGRGEHAAIEFDRCGVVSRFLYRDDLFGESNQAINPLAQILHAQDEGTEARIKNSARIRFIATVSQVLDPKIIEQDRKRFVDTNLTSRNDSGLMIVDGKYQNIQQVQDQQWLVDAGQQKAINESVYNYFGVNEKIINASYTDEEYAAFYASRIEPLAIQTSLVLTSMFFTAEDVAAGSEVLLTPARFEQMRHETKLQLSTQLFDRGIFSTNDVMRLYNLPEVEGGDKRYIRKEYCDVTMLDQINTNSEPVNKGGKDGH